MMAGLFDRLGGRYRRSLSRLLGRRRHPLNLSTPLISFSFDDFPKSALSTGGTHLAQHGLAGTYYAAFGLMGTMAPTGRIFDRTDLDALVEQGHELGCHTFDHLPAWTTRPESFEKSVRENQRALEAILPGRRFRTLSYPIEEPLPATKLLMARAFECCRAGGQTVNARMIDRNALASYFLDHRNRDDFASVREVVDLNREKRGWLIFSTHDISDSPTRYGWTEKMFAQLLEYCCRSGARILPVSAGWDLIRMTPGPCKP